jgi:mono/diheme cytochrome c family protein
MNAPKRFPVFSVVIVLALGLFVAMVLSNHITWFSKEPPFEFLSNMDHQFKAIPQSANTFFADRKSVREPVEGTVARGIEIYTLAAGDVDAAESYNKDPQLPRTDFLLARGQNRFNTFCSPCHNYDAQGNSRVAVRGAWSGIPSLVRDETKALSNARIFHIISAGQNLMPSYADKVKPIDRWAIVYYLRSLQGIQGVERLSVATTNQPVGN